METIDLKPYQWENRLLLFFAHSPDEAAYQKQLDLWEEREAEILDRDLVFFHLFQSTPGRAGADAFSAPAAEELAREYDVSFDEPTVLLIGKDGGVKLRRSMPVSPEDINALIDSMPMRQREMRE